MNEYVEYKSSLCSLRGLLGLGCLHILDKPELNPYMAKILGKLNEWLVLEGKEDLKDNIELFVEYYNDGLEKLTENRLTEFLEDYEFTSEDSELLATLAWTNIFGTIYLEELYNYPQYFTTKAIDCHECCGKIIEDSQGNTVYLPGKNNLSSEYYCGCSNK